jgi:hypothetical protein
VDEVPVALLGDVLDAFRWTAAGKTADVAVVRDLAGGLQLRGLDALSTSAKAAISHHELASAGLRTVAAEGLWLLDAEAMEQVPDTPGANDPIYLRGRISGPWGPGAVRASGRLALTRADLLAGIVEEEPHAFRLAQAPSNGGTAARCLHAAVPGGRAGDIARGEAYILAYPLVPFELQPSDAANEAFIAQLIHDVLGALRTDLKGARSAHWLTREVLPVPSRADLVDQLAREGWEIRGNTAVHRVVPRGGFTGFLSMALGSDYDRKIALPPEASPAAFMALAARMVASFPGFPDERAQAMTRRVGAGPAMRFTQPITIPPQSTPASLDRRLAASPAFPARPAGEREDWEREFERAFAEPGAPPGRRVTSMGPRPRER